MSAITIVKEEDTRPLHVKWRPESFDEVIGQDTVVNSLKSVLKSKSKPQCLMFVGTSGCGKTALAKIVAREVGTERQGLIELDAATNGSVDSIRSLTDQMDYRRMEGLSKTLILDEVHAISAQAWQALLKSTETPPPHAYYILCTTEMGKIPQTIKTRFHIYQVASVPIGDLIQYASIINEVEGLNVAPDLIALCADEAKGGVRQLLVNLSQVRSAANIDEARKLLMSCSAGDDAPLIQIARMLVAQQHDWQQMMKLAAQIDNLGGSRAVLKSYFSKVFSGQMPSGYNAKLLECLEKMPPYPDSIADLQLFL